MSVKISGSKYAAMYGPTVGDKVRLADTSLVIEVEKDYTTYGDEVKFGGGKSIRDGMGQSVKTCSRDGDLDLVITNALIVDATGIVKADIGIKDGKIAGIGKAGNPDVMDGVTPGMTVGASTEALAGEGMIVTAGGIDTHIHFISPQQIDCSLYSGVTTMIGGGTGPADGTNATTCTPGPWNLRMMLKAAEEYPMNLGFLGKGNCSDEAPLIEQVKAGAMGLKIHEDWGATRIGLSDLFCINLLRHLILPGMLRLTLLPVFLTRHPVHRRQTSAPLPDPLSPYPGLHRFSRFHSAHYPRLTARRAVFPG